MRYFLAAFFGLLVCIYSAKADLYVAPTGSDTGNTCKVQATPCKHIQYAVDRISFATVDTIHLADGLYQENIDIYYWRFVTLLGNCTTPTHVTIAAPVNGMSIIEVEDHAISKISCLQLSNGGFANVSGISGRQYSIIDFENIYFIGTYSTLISVATSTASATGPVYLTPGLSAAVFALSGYNGFLNMASPVNILGTVSVQYFAEIIAQSVMQFSTITGGNAVIGQQWIIVDSTLYNSAVVPGTIAGQSYGSATVW